MCIVTIVCLSYGLYRNKANLLTEVHGYKKDTFTRYKDGELVAGDTLTASIQSKDNNLGIIAIRFDTAGKIRNGTYTFKIKQSGASDWYYVNTYNAKAFGGYTFFPFGFPSIADSKDKTYIIELESHAVALSDAVAVAHVESAIQAKHKFSKEEVFNDKHTLVTLLYVNLVHIIFDKSVQTIFLTLSAFFLVAFIIGQRLQRIKVKPTHTKKYAHVIKKEFRYVYIILRPLFVFLNYIGSTFLRMVKLLTYFYNWIGKE
jgi:hypothetical protein